MISLKPEASVKNSSWALFSLGFRPFFLGAALFAVLSVAVWMASYVFGVQPPLLGLPAILWHAHEMIYGYSVAVIAGFLLTAVQNWTRIPTPSGYRLALLVAPWLLARLLPLIGGRQLAIAMALSDAVFTVFLLIEITRPIVLSKQWKQSLGHSGRDVQQPHPLLSYAFVALIAGALLRVMVPLFNPANYLLWIACSQALWIMAFVGFLVVYLPILTKSDIKGIFSVRSR